MVLQVLSKKTDAEDVIKNSRCLVLHFFADWVLQCQNMNEVLEEMQTLPEYSSVKFAKIPAEEVPEISLQYNVIAVPTIVLFKSGVQYDRVEGANPGDLRDKVKALINTEGLLSPTKEDLESRLKGLITSAPVILFMKGSVKTPRCGFSKQIVEILMSHNAQFKTFDILSDQTVREGLKKYSNWPTYPQLYINGELVGGLDIVKEMQQNGELQELLPKTTSLEDRLTGLINQANVMIFMKGNKDTPRCGFSRQLVQILNDAKVEYSTFDILEDEEVRQGLKEYSNWPTYPQLYIKGQLIGGLDIVKELQASGEFQQLLP